MRPRIFHEFAKPLHRRGPLEKLAEEIDLAPQFLARNRLSEASDETGMIIEVCHYPPGTSKWNKIEHRVFCHITRSWQGVPLENLEIVVESIGATTTKTGLEVHAWLDEKDYVKGRKVSDEDLADCRIVPNKYHGEWNYEIHPRE